VDDRAAVLGRRSGRRSREGGTADLHRKENNAMATAPTRDVARWRVGLFKVLAALFVVFQLFNIGNLMAPWNADPALALTGLAAPDTHLWHAALPGAVRLLLTGGVAAALLFRPASKPLLVQWLTRIHVQRFDTWFGRVGDQASSKRNRRPPHQGTSTSGRSAERSTGL
jgi:hypothetical protein